MEGKLVKNFPEGNLKAFTLPDPENLLLGITPKQFLPKCLQFWLQRDLWATGEEEWIVQDTHAFEIPLPWEGGRRSPLGKANTYSLS